MIKSILCEDKVTLLATVRRWYNDLNREHRSLRVEFKKGSPKTAEIDRNNDIA